MKNTILKLLKNTFFTIFLIFIISVNLQAQSWQYAKSFGGESGSDPTNNNMPNNLVLDNNGNAYVYGTYGAGTEFNDSTLSLFIDGNRGGFIAKYNCAGDIEWFKAISNSEQRDDQANYMILKDDYLYLSGSCHIDNFYKTWFLDTLVIGSILVQDYPQNSVFPWIPYRNYSYIMKMDLQGNILDYHLLSLYNDNITKSFILNLWNDPSHQRGFAIDNEGNYYLLARLSTAQTSVIFCNETAITDTITPIYDSGFNEYFLLKFDSEFNLLWFKPIVYGVNDPNNYGLLMDFYDMACDSQNNLYMVGYLLTNNDSLEIENYLVEVDLGNNQHLETYINDLSVGFLLKMNSEGEVQWTQQSKGYSYESRISNCMFESLVLDEETNNIYVSGWAVPVRENAPNTGTIFGGVDTLVGYFTITNPRTGIIANYDTDGNYKWVRNMRSREGFVSSLGLYDNKLYGTVKWLVNLQHDQLYENSSSYGFTVCVWDTAGNAIESIDIPTTCTNPNKLYPFDTRVNSWGEIFTTGTYDYGLTFGDHYIYGEGFKMFIAKYGNLCPFISEETDNFCYGTEYNGTVLTESGDYQFVLESSTPDVDSVINLHATVYPQLTTGINDTTFCTDETYLLEADLGYNTYTWSTGSENPQQELTYSSAGLQNVYVTLTDDNCTGVDTILVTVEICSSSENPIMQNISIYPVPANTHISIQVPSEEIIMSYEIYNLQGKVIKSESKNNGSQITIAVGDLRAGEYLIYIKTEKTVYSGGFIKNK